MSKASRKSASARSRTVTLRTPNKNLSLRVNASVAAPAQRKLREINGTLLLEAAKALGQPGIARKAVFTDATVSSYSVHPSKPDLYVRESSSGDKVIGRLVNGQFRPVANK
jgi:hypothetical protein